MIAERAVLSPVDLAPGGVYLAVSVTRDAGGLLHHRFTLTEPKLGGLLSVARAVALRAQPLAGTLPCGARTFLRWFAPPAIQAHLTAKS